MNPYGKFVSEIASLVSDGKSLPLGGFAPLPRPTPAHNAPTVLFFAPHPDDETIGGGLALRLLRESKWNVIDIAITLGRLKERKPGRMEELRNACNFLGFGLESAAPEGFDGVTAATRSKDPAAWAQMVKITAAILEKHKPKAIFLPHELVRNRTHIATQFLVMDALKATQGVECHLIETEFWGQMQTPNLLVEYTRDIVADLVAATSFHVLEVKRNPYHVLIPAWMMDNVRRGAELVGGQGGAAPSFEFAQVFRLRKWTGSQVEDCLAKGRFSPANEDPSAIFAVYGT